MLYAATSLAFSSATEMLATAPESKERWSASTPSEKITPSCGIWLAASRVSPARTSPHTIPDDPRRRRLADERLPDAEAKLRRVPGEAEPLADRRHRPGPCERLDDTSRAVEDGAEPAGGPRTSRNDDAAG
jgi:hypothetical protein